MGISREAAVAWIVSDTKLVSFTSRHLGNGPTQHDTFVRARCNRAVLPVGSRELTSTSLSYHHHHFPVTRRGKSTKKRRRYKSIGSQCAGHAYEVHRDWPDPIHVAMVTFLRPSVRQCRDLCLCWFNYPFHMDI